MRVDTAVVGAGIVGLAIARQLQQAGQRVRVWDQGKAGGESSWAGAGMLAPHGESFPDPAWTAKAFAALAMYPAWIAALERESGLPIDFRVCGAREWRDGAWLEFPDEAVVDPRNVVAALAQGLEIEQNVRVEDPAALDADTVVIAAGAWSGLLPGLPPTVPVKGHMLAYQLPPGSLPHILRSGHTYIVQRRTGLTLVGSNEEEAGFDRSLNRAALDDLRQRGEQLWPELATRQPVDAWTGFRPATPDRVPVVRPLAGTRLWLAYGHFRNGILLAPQTAAEVAASIAARYQSTGTP